MDSDPMRIGNVIVVDAEFQEYEILATSVSERNLKLQMFKDGDEAIRSSVAMWCKLWLVNLHLPDMTGIELMSIIRDRDPQAAIFLVGNAYDPRDEIAARSAGPTAYVCKPPHPLWLSCVSPSVRAVAAEHTSDNEAFSAVIADY